MEKSEMENSGQRIRIESRPLIPVWGAIPLYMICSFLAMGVMGGIPVWLFRLFPEVYYKIPEHLVMSAVSLAAVWLCAVLFLKYIDMRPVGELGMNPKGRWKDCLAGVLFAAVLYAIGFSVSLALGSIEIASVNLNWGVLGGTFIVYFFYAAMEEVMVRGYIQGRLMSKMNQFVALGIASVIFSVMHISNPNMGILPLINLFLAGVMLGASYIYTRNLWFPILLHTAWNWIQGPVLGYEVSGTKEFPSVIQLLLPDENIINGGHFGFEGSVVCTILTIIATACIIGWYERKKNRD